MKVQLPPEQLDLSTALKSMNKKFKGNHTQWMEFYKKFNKTTDEKGRYLHWDEFKHRLTKDDDELVAWSLTKHARNSGKIDLPFVSVKGENSHMNITPFMQHSASIVDRMTSQAALDALIAGDDAAKYLINELTEEESISSSQLEGAATTTIVAKEMLQTARKPRTEDERMILGNFKMMKAVWEYRAEPLSADLIKSFHKIGVEGIDDEKYIPGEFRLHDSVSVVDELGETIHQPPSFERLNYSIDQLCEWANHSHEKLFTSEYIHPLIKSSILHFMLGYLHPFNDGNGRTARALFYWYMLKCGYSAFQHISISKLLKKAPVAYVKSYLHSETDAFDLTYFICYQCEIVSRAVEEFQQHVVKTIEDKRNFNIWLWESGLMAKLNQRQQILTSVAMSHFGKYFSVKEVMENFNISNNTARGDLKTLVDLGLLTPVVSGRETFYVAPKNIKEARKKLSPKTTK